MRKIVIIVALVVTAQLSYGQFRAVNRLSFESNIGFALTHGDVAPSTVGVGLQLGTVYSLLRSMGVGFSVNYSSLGSRTDQYNRSFKTTVFGFQMDYHINIPQLLTDYPQSFPVSPYFRIGVGYDFSLPTEVNFGDVSGAYDYTAASAESSTFTALTVPTVIGAFFRLNQYADINLKFNYVYADSDMMDGHSPPVIGNKYNDSYSMILVGVRMKSWDRRKPHITGR